MFKCIICNRVADTTAIEWSLGYARKLADLCVTCATDVARGAKVSGRIHPETESEGRGTRTARITTETTRS